MQQIVLMPGLKPADLPPSFAYAMNGRRCQALEMLLSRAVITHHPSDQGLAETLFRLADIAVPAGDLPIAALTRLADSQGEPDRGWWLRADPVFLRPDQSRLILLGSDHLQVKQEEAARLASEINRQFAEDNWLLQALHPERWYLQLPDDPQFCTHPLPRVIGQNINSYLPFGPQGKKWHAVLNELQMLLFASEVNREREKRGQPAINSVWLWGGGRLPDVKAPWTQVWSNHPLAQGMARAAGIAGQSLPMQWENCMANHTPGPSLLVIDEPPPLTMTEDMEQWLLALLKIDENYFSPMLSAMKSGLITQLDILDCAGRCYHVTPRRLRYFWRRPQPLAAKLREG